jgi:hypothetical protein
MRLLSLKIGEKILRSVGEHKLNHIGYRELQRKTGLRSKTFDPWIERLRECNALSLPPKNKIRGKKVPISLTAKAMRYYKADNIPVYLKKRLGNRIQRKKLSYNRQKRIDTCLLISIIATIGYVRYELMPGKRLGQRLEYIDFIKSKISWTSVIPYSRPGIGLEDLIKRRGILGKLDETKNIGINRLFSYIDLTKSQLLEYINDMKEGTYPILKVISIDDYAFHSFVYDIDNQNGGIAEKDEFKYRYIVNEKGSKLQFYHDIYYDGNNNKVSSKLVFDVNYIKTRKYLKLESIYKNDQESFSRSLWSEPRYTISDPLLKEFIIDCMGFLWSSIDIMEYLYEYEYRGLNSKYKREYFKWSKRLFGTKIRALENKRPKYRKLPIWRKKLYMDNLEHYKQKVYDKKYSIIQSKYSIISRHLLKIVYPSFLNIEGY